MHARMGYPPSVLPTATKLQSPSFAISSGLHQSRTLHSMDPTWHPSVRSMHSSLPALTLALNAHYRCCDGRIRIHDHVGISLRPLNIPAEKTERKMIQFLPNQI